MQMYAQALDAPNSDRVEIRLALARLFAQAGRYSDAQQQVSFALAEARIGEANAVTPENLIEAADVLMSTHEFDLAKKYFERAQTLGADDEAVSVGLANAYLAQGQTQSAAQILKGFGNTADNNENYEYLIAMGNVYRQQQDTARALSMYARANQVAQGNEYSEQTEIDLAGDVGRQLTPSVSVRPDFSLSPIFEDINIYQLDARLLGVSNIPALLPTPRSSTETLVDARSQSSCEKLSAPEGFPARAKNAYCARQPNAARNRFTIKLSFRGNLFPRNLLLGPPDLSSIRLNKKINRHRSPNQYNRPADP